MPASPVHGPPTGLTISLPAQDLAATRDFYVRDLGLPPTTEESTRLVVAVGSSTVEFRPHEGTALRGCDVRLTFECLDADGLLHRLRTLGVEVDVPPANETTGVRFLARDPDGRLVAFTRRGR